MKYHPDRNPEAGEKVGLPLIFFLSLPYSYTVQPTSCTSLPRPAPQFKEISNAYDILSNPEKREIYDRHGIDGLKEGRGAGWWLALLGTVHAVSRFRVQLTSFVLPEPAFRRRSHGLV